MKKRTVKAATVVEAWHDCRQRRTSSAAQMQSGGKCFKHIFCQFLFFFLFSFMLFLLLLFLYRGCCRFAVVLFVCSLPQVKTGTQRDIPLCACVCMCMSVSVCVIIAMISSTAYNERTTRQTDGRVLLKQHMRRGFTFISPFLCRHI